MKIYSSEMYRRICGRLQFSQWKSSISGGNGSLNWWRTYVSGSENNGSTTHSENGGGPSLIIKSDKSIEMMDDESSSSSTSAMKINHGLPVYRSGVWTNEEKQRFKEIIEKAPHRDWITYSQMMVTRSPHQCKMHFRGAILPKYLKGAWSKEEDATLVRLVEELGMRWSLIAKNFTNRSESSCRYRYYNHHFSNLKHTRWTDDERDKVQEMLHRFGNRWMEFSMNLDRSPDSIRYQANYNLVHVRKGPWTKEEDEKLRQLVEKHGKRFTLVSKEFGTRNFSQCYQRWCHSVDPSIRKGPWTEVEDVELQKAVKLHGRRWLLVMSAVPGRTPAQCRLRYAYLTNPRKTSLRNPGLRIDWTETQDQEILRLRNKEIKTFREIGEILNISRNTVAGRYYNTLMPHLRGPPKNTSPWTSEEEERLKELHHLYGDRWSHIASQLNTGRTQQQVKQRIQLNLNPDRLTCRWTKEEDEELRKLYDQYGHRWTLISCLLRTRSPTQCHIRMRRIIASRLKSPESSALLNPSEHSKLSSTTAYPVEPKVV
jgi:hypothetical protein